MSLRISGSSGGRRTFCGFPRCEDLESLKADVGIIGIPYRCPYVVNIPDNPEGVLGSGTEADAPAMLREYSKIYDHSINNHNFDFGGELFAGRQVQVVDCGDLQIAFGRHEENLNTITQAARAILKRGAVPVVLGGDHGTPIPVLWAYDNLGPICVVQIDAHMDFIDQRNGIKEGYSSVGRRATEMPWVSGLYQIGLRGVGSAGKKEVEAARAYGTIMITAEQVHLEGIDQVLKSLPTADRYYITICADGLDPSIAPAVSFPEPGGLTYYEITNLFRGIAKRGKILGLDFTSWLPSLDVRNLTAIFASRLILNFLGALAHAGHIGL